MAKFDYDTGAAPEHREGGGALMPEGDYVGQVIESTIDDNSKGTGKVLALTWELLNDGFRGRKVWQRINVVHTTSTEAQRIGQIEFANLKDVVGLGGQTVRDTLTLHNKPAGLRLKIEIGNPKPSPNPNGACYPDKNQVAGYFKAEDFVPAGAAPAAAAPVRAVPSVDQAPAPAAPAPASAGGMPPWMKKAA